MNSLEQKKRWLIPLVWATGANLLIFIWNVIGKNETFLYALISFTIGLPLFYLGAYYFNIIAYKVCGKTCDYESCPLEKDKSVKSKQVKQNKCSQIIFVIKAIILSICLALLQKLIFNISFYKVILLASFYFPVAFIAFLTGNYWSVKQKRECKHKTCPYELQE